MGKDSGHLEEPRRDGTDSGAVPWEGTLKHKRMRGNLGALLLV